MIERIADPNIVETASESYSFRGTLEKRNWENS
jgi:hypothetical protein